MNAYRVYLAMQRAGWIPLCTIRNVLHFHRGGRACALVFDRDYGTSMVQDLVLVEALYVRLRKRSNGSIQVLDWTRRYPYRQTFVEAEAP